MKNLLKRLGMSPKRTIRVSRYNRAAFAASQITSSQIAKMGRFGQQLVVMSK
jgi:hypothetical protein